ncbi:MAG TPA: hypothetical protein VFO76_12640 [Candidatus Kapabacteria bacterium]|nr:hypothetical protein [Candidatus Kapabacteria bacterium]
MRVFFSSLFLLVGVAAFAQHPTVTWETEKPDHVQDYPDKLKDFHGVVIFERSTVEVFSLLNMIFFPKDSSSLRRYLLFSTPGQTANYTEDTTTGTIDAHSNSLNILGYRLRNNPTITIGLTGCSGNDNGKLDLATARAQTIKQYLVTIWGIDPKRIKTTARILPEHPSDVNTKKGREENRRVEIISDDWNIMGPVIATRYVRYPDPRRALLYISPITDPIITKRTIKISYQDKPWATIEVPKGDTTIEWNWHSDATRILPAPNGITNPKLPPPEGVLTAQLFLTDAHGRTTESAIDSIGIKLIPYQTIPENPTAMRREVYYIPLRMDEQQAIGKLNKTYIDSIILSRITPSSDVEIIGFMNEESAKNQARSESIVASIKKYLEPKTLISNSNITTKYYSNGVLFDPTFPEGRMFNRSAEVIIDTPWDYGSR